VARVAHTVLTTPPPGSRNVTEWAKQKGCWQRLKDEDIRLPSSWMRELVPATEQKLSERTAIKEQRVLNGIEAQTAVLNAGATFWREARDWGASRKLLSPLELGVLEVASQVPLRIPSEKQSAVVLNTLTRLQTEGCQLRLSV
jgi:hypothetical protein